VVVVVALAIAVTVLLSMLRAVPHVARDREVAPLVYSGYCLGTCLEVLSKPHGAAGTIVCILHAVRYKLTDVSERTHGHRVNM
jgi:hypothetical protein